MRRTATPSTCCCSPRTRPRRSSSARIAFDLADRLQTPIFVMLDLDIGMNHRLCRPLNWDDTKRYDRGKVMTAAELEAGKDFGRYLDVDGDGIPYRTYPGTHPTKGSFFTRGTSRDRYARYTEEGAAYVDNMQRLLRKFETAKNLVPRPVRRKRRQADQIRRRSISARPRPRWTRRSACSRRDGNQLDTLRMRAFPFHQDVADFIADHDFVFVVEQNRDAPDALADRQRMQHRSDAARADPAFRRHPDHGPLHRPRDRRPPRRAEGHAAAQGAGREA